MRVAISSTLVFLSFAAVSPVFLFGQSDPPASVPRVVRVCDKVMIFEACADWTWNGTGYSYKYSKASGTGTITRVGPTQMRLRRTDNHASWPIKAGIAEYVGTLDTDHSARGQSTYTVQGQPPMQGTWTATFAPVELGEAGITEQDQTARQSPNDASVKQSQAPAQAGSSSATASASSQPNPLIKQPQPGWDAVAVACPDFANIKNGGGSSRAFLEEGRKMEDIQRDGQLGSDLGHAPEALHAYCQAAALGNAAAEYQIAMLMETGYTTYTVNASGSAIKTGEQARDIPAAIHWWTESANAGFTRSMAALAIAYGYGPDFITPGANLLALDREQSAFWLKMAADAGDTQVLLTLVSNYLKQPVPVWMTGLKLPSGRKSAEEAYASYAKIMTAHGSECAAFQQQAGRSLPESARSRIVSSSVEAVHGSDTSKPLEVDCLLHMTDPPRDRQETVFEQMKGPLDGSEVTTWRYTLTHIPRYAGASMRVEPLRDAVKDTFMDMATQIKTIMDGLSSR